MKRVYVDTEYMYEDMFHERRMPREDDKKQIIQIAAVLFDHKTGREIKYIDILVKPIFHNELPDFFTELTSINKKMLEEHAVSFPEALEQFVAFCEKYPIWTFDNDYNVFLQNLEFHSLENPFEKPFSRIKPTLKNFGIDPEKYSSGTLYKAAGLNLDGHVHYALHDVRSLSRAIHVIEGY